MKHAISDKTTDGADNPSAKYWICDTCGGHILEAEDGWVESLSVWSAGARNMEGLRLVHSWKASKLIGKTRCQYDKDSMPNTSICDFRLDDFVGPDGLMELLSMLAGGEFLQNEVLEIIKRLHIPGYECARLHFDEALAEAVFDPNTPRSFYTQDDISRVLAWAERKGKQL